LLRSCGWFSRALDVENIWKSYLLEKKMFILSIFFC
jgi:hypothetical protein